MGAVLTIAGRDLRSYFSSLKGSVIFCFFILIIGVFFSSFINMFMELQQRAGMMGGEAPTLDQLLTAVFQNIQFILLLFIPAVTMSSFSAEKRSGVDKLLSTAPVAPWQIVFGKFFASAGLMAMVLIASSVFPLFTIKFGNPDVGVILSAYLGLFLLICAEVAFGMWISSLTSSQLIAGIFIVFGLFLLFILNWIAPSITGNSEMESLIKYLASTTHLDTFLKGMITVGDVTYFLLFIGTFLFFTNVVLASQRWR